MHFNTKRLLLAVTSFALAFGAFNGLGIDGIVVSSVVGISLGTTCLIIQPTQIWPSIRTSLITIFGMITSVVVFADRHSDEFAILFIGGFIGFLMGTSITASEKSPPEEPEQESSSLSNPNTEA